MICKIRIIILHGIVISFCHAYILNLIKMQILRYVGVIIPFCINLCSNKSEFAFFVRSFGCALFIICMEKKVRKIP